MLQPNTILLTRYKIDRAFNQGERSIIYAARDLNYPNVRRMVAVKELVSHASDPKLRTAILKSFEREANLLATLDHPAIPKIYDFFSQDDRAYIIMEYINGYNLETLLEKTKSLPMEKILEWAISLCEVLHYLHSHQPDPIIFRDMRPQNVMIDSQGRVRLVGFGIAKVYVKGLPQTMIGTEGYSPPEQYKGKGNPLSDIYSLGATLHHVITRTDPRLEPPFSFSKRRLSEHNPDAPEELQRVLDKALAFEPEQRYQSADEFKQDLLMIRDGRALHQSTHVLSPDAIFISYKRLDWEDYVQPLVQKLQAAGLPVWVDQRLLHSGDDWLDEINKALKTCKRMILCVSPEALDSRHVKLEYRYFFNRDKKIYPLICRETALPAELETIQHYPYERMDALIDLLKRGDY